MSTTALLTAGDPVGKRAPLQEQFDFVVVPRAGEHIAIIEMGRDLLIEVISVTHLPNGPKVVADEAEVHIWGTILDYSYQV